MLSQFLAGIRAEAPSLLRIGFLLGDQGDGAIETNSEDIIAVFQTCVSLAVFDVGTKAAHAREDRLAVFRRQSDFARQRQQTERLFEIDVVGRNAFRNAGAFWLLDFLFLFALLRLRRLDLLAELQIGPKAAATQRHLKAGDRVFAQHLLALNAVGTGRDLPREIAIRIIRTADEGAEASGLQRKLAGIALRALPARRAVGVLRENMRLEQIVERVEHDAVAHFLDLVDRADELTPELGKHRAPVDRAGGNLVELFFEAGGEIVFDVAREETFQEGDDDAAFVFRNEPLLVDADIAAVLQHLQDRGVGRWPADAELFHALDQRGFREARRRLGEML